MLQPRKFAFATPKDLGKGNYRRFCRAAGLQPIPDGYGMLLAVDDAGENHTLVTADVEYVRVISSAGADALAGLEIPEDKFLNRSGWPDSWA